MAASIISRIPVVAGLAYVERVRLMPSTFMAMLVPEPGQRYFHDAIAVTVAGEKVGYIAPEVARRYYKAIASVPAGSIACPGRRGSTVDRETSGVELLLDFSGLSLTPAD